MKNFIFTFILTNLFSLSLVFSQAIDFTIAPQSIVIAEDNLGGYTSYKNVTVVLNSSPSNDVTVTFDISAHDEFTITPSTLTFNSSNWNRPQVVLVVAVNDGIIDYTTSSVVNVTSSITIHDSGSGDGSHDSGSGDGSHDSGSGDGSHDSGSGDGSHDSGSGDGSHDSGSGDGSHDSGSGDGNSDEGNVYTKTNTLSVTVHDSTRSAQITFNEDWIAASTKGDEGAVATIIDDPSNSNKGKVLNVVYGGAGSQDWQNAQIFIPGGQKKIDLRTTKTVTFDVWTNHDASDANKGKYSGLLKLETPTTGSGTIEKGFVTSGNGWETITVDFTDNFKNDNGDAGSNDQFRKIVLFTNYGGGDEAHQVSGGVHKKVDTRVYDNFVYAEGDVVPPLIPPTPNTNLVVTFEGNDINSDDLNLGATTGTAIVTDPTNSSNKVLKIEYVEGPGWGNNAGFDIPEEMNTIVANTITFDIWSDHSSSATQENGYGYMLKLEQPVGFIEKSFKVDGAGAWQTVTIDLSNCDYKHPTGNCGGQENAGNEFTRFLLFHWGGSNPSSSYPDTIYIDNIKYDEGTTLGLANTNLADAIGVYPNPTNGIVNISGVEKVDAIRVFSISGQLIKQAVNANFIDLSTQRKGLYMIEIEHEGANSVSKLILR